MFYKHSKENEKLLPNGVTRAIKGYIKDLMVCELSWNKGMVGEPHTPTRSADISSREALRLP